MVMFHCNATNFQRVSSPFFYGFPMIFFPCWSIFSYGFSYEFPMFSHPKWWFAMVVSIVFCVFPRGFPGFPIIFPCSSIFLWIFQRFSHDFLIFLWVFLWFSYAFQPPLCAFFSEELMLACRQLGHVVSEALAAVVAATVVSSAGGGGGRHLCIYIYIIYIRCIFDL